MLLRKARKGQRRIIDSDDEDQTALWVVNINQASRALALHWLWNARQFKIDDLRNRGKDQRESLAEILKKMPETEDWFFGSELRLEGEQLVDQGELLREEQIRLDQEEEEKIQAVQQDVDRFENEKRDAINVEREAFDKMITREREEAQESAIATEKQRIEKKKTKEVEFQQVERLAKDGGNG